MSLLEIAILVHESKLRLTSSVDALFADIAESALTLLLPLTFEIASQAGSLIALRDPANRAIVATALVHRLKLVTSDQRIIASRLVPVID